MKRHAIAARDLAEPQADILYASAADEGYRKRLFIRVVGAAVSYLVTVDGERYAETASAKEAVDAYNAL